MVSVTLELSDERAAVLRARAEAEGVSVGELVSRALNLDDDEGVHPDWNDEIRRRIRGIDDGSANARPADDVFADIRARFGW
jgi:hypothetical protein